MQGGDLSGVVLGRTDRGPDSAFFQIFVPFAGDGTPRPWRGVRTDSVMYARTEAGPWMLYDLEDDPYEMKNLADDPAHAALRDRMEAKLAAWMKRTGDSWAFDSIGLRRGRRPPLPVRGVLHRSASTSTGPRSTRTWRLATEPRSAPRAQSGRDPVPGPPVWIKIDLSHRRDRRLPRRGRAGFGAFGLRIGASDPVGIDPGSDAPSEPGATASADSDLVG